MKNMNSECFENKVLRNFLIRRVSSCQKDPAGSQRDSQ